jgi:hypothetical protein
MPPADVPHYPCVFRAAEDVTDDVIDLGQDPDFRPPAATWEICRYLARERQICALNRGRGSGFRRWQHRAPLSMAWASSGS